MIPANASTILCIAINLVLALLVLQSFSYYIPPNYLIFQFAHSQLESNDKKILIYSADSLYDQQKYTEALTLYDKVLATDPNDISALSGKGDVLFAQSRCQEAIESYDRILTIDVNNLYALGSKAA